MRVHSSAVERRIADPEVAGSIPVAPYVSRGYSRLAQLVERKTLNLVVVGSSPTVGSPGASPWRNGSASDSRPEGWGFKSLWAHLLYFGFAPMHKTPITHTPGAYLYTPFS